MIPEQVIPLWADRANCLTVDPDLFFPSKGGTPRWALAVCEHCPVKPECLEWALLAEESTTSRYGIWGGATPAQRDTIARIRVGKAPRHRRLRNWHNYPGVTLPGELA
jgi:WhiB family transcriptional regulator, redox-sensing transcriptional regulator